MDLIRMWIGNIFHRGRLLGVAALVGVLVFLYSSRSLPQEKKSFGRETPGVVIFPNPTQPPPPGQKISIGTRTSEKVVFPNLSHTPPSLGVKTSIGSRTTQVGIAQKLSPSPPPTTPAVKCADRKDDEQIECWIGTENLDKNGTFYRILLEKADKNKSIFLASVDSSFIDMAVNMYHTSFRKFNITNFLYVCSDAKAMDMLRVHGIDCFLYPQNTDNEHATEYGSKAFILKMRVKMKMVTAALMLGFTTVLTDLDIVFFRNPLPELMKYEADIMLMDDVVMDNCGFYIAHPTKAGVELHQRTLRMCMTRIIADQDAIGSVIGDMTKKKTLIKGRLDKYRFACGLVYFESGKRMFSEDRPCDSEKCESAVVHNNWIVSKAAKIFRFKETGLWLYDNNGYYSNPEGKYLTYQNPIDLEKKNLAVERAALLTALSIGRILNRTVILPRFHCQGCSRQSCLIAKDHCSFHAHFHVRTFDEHFLDGYRENTFLENPFVPEAIKNSASKQILIKNTNFEDKMKTVSEKVLVLNTTDSTIGKVTKADILKLFSTKEYQNYSVLNFHSLYFDIPEQESEWIDKLNSAIKYSTYRQYHVKR